MVNYRYLPRLLNVVTTSLQFVEVSRDLLPAATIRVMLSADIDQSLAHRDWHLARAAADVDNCFLLTNQTLNQLAVLADDILDVDLLRLVARECGEGLNLQSAELSPLVGVEVVGVSVAASVEQVRFAYLLSVYVFLLSLPDQRSAGCQSGARSDEDERKLRGFLGQIVEFVGKRKADVHRRVFRKGGEVTRTETMANFLEDGTVLDESDDDLEFDISAISHVQLLISSSGKAVFSAADGGEEGGGVLPRDLDAREILEDFEDAATRAGCIIVEFFSKGLISKTRGVVLCA